jgi:esterase/lipase superfamily enzyme
MQGQHDLVPSRTMDRRMHLWRFGHYGFPLLVFPSASGMAHEWEANGMLDAVSDLIEGGQLKVYCTESNVAEAWTRREGDPAWRLSRHAAFERYVVEELVPLIQADCRTADIPIAVGGTSLGAYYAANFALKRSRTFRWALCLSGRYDVSWLADGYSGADLYYNNPMAFVPNLDGPSLEEVRRHTHLTLVCGQGKWEDGNVEDTRTFARLLAGKGINHEADLWGRDASHEWVWWRRQARYHLLRRFGRG